MTRLSRIVVFIFTICVFSQIFPYPDFEDSLRRYGHSNARFNASMGKKCAKRVHSKHRSKNKNKCRNYQIFQAYKRLYEKNINIEAQSSFKIPPIVHQIWIGPPMPEEFKVLMKTWEGWLGWEYKFWTEAEIDKLQMVNRDIYAQATNPSEKADIARMEILRLYGGIYVGVDFECVNPLFFYDLARKYTFVLGIEPLEHSDNRIGSAFIASAPFHPLISKLVTNLEVGYHINNIIMTRTGPDYLTNVILLNFHLLADSGILLPPTFVYPVTSSKEEIDNLEAFIMPETAAIHYWSNSWILSHPQNLDHIKEGRWRSRSEDIFSEIYRAGDWGKDEWGYGISGPGSTLQEGRPFIEFLQNFLEEHEIHSIVDIGCGDWMLAKEIDWGQRTYIGIDVVEEIIKRDQKKYGSESIKFLKRDVALEPIPVGDLLICKDVLMHLSFSDIFNVLSKINNYKYCILVHDVDYTAAEKNIDIESGGYRNLDITQPPFKLKAHKVATYTSGGCVKQIVLIVN